MAGWPNGCITLDEGVVRSNTRRTQWLLCLGALGAAGLVASCLPPAGLETRVAAARAESALANVSMAAIVAAPERHHGRYVRVKGFLRWRPEWHALYLHRDDAENGIDESAVWLDASLAGEYGAKDGNYVILEGTFEARRRDETTAFAGTIRVYALALWGPNVLGRGDATAWRRPVRARAAGGEGTGNPLHE